MNLPEIANDKLKHFFWGYALAAPGLLVAILLLIFTDAGAWVAVLPMVLPIGGGLRKEIKDLKGEGKPEVMDFVYTAAGGVQGSVGLLAGILW